MNMSQEPQDEVSNDNQKRAVDGVSFGVKRGEVLALLGLSGAGKSSTFSMLLGEEPISGGKAYLNERDIDNMYYKPHELHGLVGYCPQANNIESFSVEKSLYYIAELVGVQYDKVEQVVNDTIYRFDLQDHRHKTADTLSGGNKRKLCCAQALLGNPPVMLVDEVSAGVDPIARRKVWKAMQFESESSALILTTHTMEEAEALAHRIAIMSAGKFKCFGSLQQIQQVYGSGFEIEMNLRLEDIVFDLGQMDAEQRLCLDQQIIHEQVKKWEHALETTHNVKLALDYTKEFSRAGLFAAEFEQTRAGTKIDLRKLQRDVQVQNEVALIVQELTDTVSFAEVIAFDGSYLVLRLQRQENLSYGRLYALME